MTDIVERRRRRERIETDPVARQRYDEMIAIARELTGLADDAGWEVMADALTLVLDVEQPPPTSPPERRVGDVVTRYHSVNFPVAPGDEALRSEDIQFRYAMREVLAWLRGGVTPVELSKLGLPSAWDVISQWVDETRRGGLADYIDRHGGEWTMQRDPGESDEQFERRRQLFVGGGRISIDTGELTPEEIVRLRNEMPPPPVRRGIVIRGGELERRDDWTDEEWVAAQARHEISRRIGQLFILQMTIDSAISALCDVEEPTPAHLREVADIADDVLRALYSSSRREEMTEAHRELSERVLEVRRVIAGAEARGESEGEESLRLAEGRRQARAGEVEDMDDVIADIENIIRGAADETPLVAFGSGNLARDLGIPNPEAVTFKWRLARVLALAMADRNLDTAAVAELAGEIEPAEVDRIAKGMIKDIDGYEIMRLLKTLGYRIVVDVMAPADGVDGVIWVNEPSGYRYDEKAIEMLKGMDPRRKK